jgi:hypothetical protein
MLGEGKKVSSRRFLRSFISPTTTTMDLLVGSGRNVHQGTEGDVKMTLALETSGQSDLRDA